MTLKKFTSSWRNTEMEINFLFIIFLVIIEIPLNEIEEQRKVDFELNKGMSDRRWIGKPEKGLSIMHKK